MAQMWQYREMDTLLPLQITVSLPCQREDRLHEWGTSGRPIVADGDTCRQTVRVLHRLIDLHKIDSDTYMTSQESLHILHSLAH